MPGRRTSQTHDPRSPLDKERLSLTSQRFLSPLDTDPSYRLPRESAPSCGEPWGRRPHAAASRRGASWPDASRKGAVCGYHVAQNALFRYIAAREAWDATPRQAAGHYGEWPNWANALEQPPPARLRGGLRWDLQAPAWGLIARKGAVWAEGLADGAPWAKPRHHQAASCGLRRCRKLRVRRNPLGVEHVPELGDRQEACDGTVPVAADHRREATIRKLLSAPFALTRPTCGHTCLQAPPARRAYPVR